MATLTDMSAIGAWPVGDGVSEPQARGATACGLTGPDLLGKAAAVLPEVVGRGPVRCADVHTALYDAACVLGVGCDRPHRLRLADEALDLFAAYLVASRYAAPASRTSGTIRGWLVYADRDTVQMMLTTAARHWRQVLDTELTQVARPAA